MTGWLGYLALGAFVAGLVGGVHCAAMCGPIVTAFGARGDARGWRFTLAYNGGRILSYVLAGTFAGLFGAAGLALRGGAGANAVLAVLAGSAMIALALHLAGYAPLTRRLEAAGGVLWRRLQPHTRWFLPANTVPRALGLGALWGWLPCGMVYGVLLTALATGSAAEGALVMLAFGAGTLPNLLAISAAAGKLRTSARTPAVRRGVALALATVGVLAIAGVIHPAAFGADGFLCRVLPVAAHH